MAGPPGIWDAGPSEITIGLNIRNICSVLESFLAFLEEHEHNDDENVVNINALVQEYYDTFHPPRVDPNENGVTIDALVQEYHNNAEPPLVDPAPVFAPTSTTDPAPVSSTTSPPSARPSGSSLDEYVKHPYIPHFIEADGRVIYFV